MRVPQPPERAPRAGGGRRRASRSPSRGPPARRFRSPRSSLRSTVAGSSTVTFTRSLPLRRRRRSHLRSGKASSSAGAAKSGSASGASGSSVPGAGSCGCGCGSGSGSGPGPGGGGSGGTAGTSAAVPSSCTHCATDGTPSFSRKSMYQPGGATFADGGLCSVRPPGCSATVVRGTSRWFMSFACVTAAGATSTASSMSPAVPTPNGTSHRTAPGAEEIAGRGPRKRYGGE